MESVFQFLGRLHPMVLHAPIGLLIGLLGVEAVAAFRRQPVAPGVRSVLAWLAAISALVSAVTGLTLSAEDAYTAEGVQVHKWLGISVAVLCIALALVQQRGRVSLYRGLLVVTTAVLIPTGHFGAALTHGEGFLTAPFHPAPPPRAIEARITAAPDSQFALVVVPIFENNCVTCHGPRKQKGGLALNTPDAIMDGGETGPVVEAGDAAHSDIIRRMKLPVEDRDHMPPKGKRQPTADEIRAVEDWVAAGASFDSPGAAGATPAARADAPAGPPPADEAALRALRERLVNVEPVERGSNLLLVDFAAIAGRTTDEDAVTLLTPIREQVRDLSIARSRAGDGVLKLAARMPNLARLNVSNSAVTDDGVAALAGHPALAELLITQTGVTDGAIESLASMPALKRVYVWRTAITAEGLERLRRAAATVDAGDSPASAALDAEKELKFTSDAPPPGAARAEVLKPVNTVCPVSGKPADPEFAIVYKGRVIAFCCRNCAAEFWAEPAKFESKLP